MTSGGGKYNKGTIFVYNIQENTHTILYNFNSNAYSPAGTLTFPNGKFYGTTRLGGVYKYGTIFSFDASTLELTIEHEFHIEDGAFPYGGLLVASNGKMYGTASEGGATSLAFGTLYEFDPDDSSFNKLNTFYTNFSFLGPRPYSSLIEPFGDGILYGTVSNGNTTNYLGQIFEYNINTSTFTERFNFPNASTSGYYPWGKLTKGPSGELYGCTIKGGATHNFTAYECGTLYTFNTSTFAKTTVKTLTHAEGRHIYGSLVLASNGKFYGTTLYGGTYDKGVLFEFNPTGNVYTVKYHFNQVHITNEDWGFYNAYGELVEANGKLYGTTFEGGTQGGGTLYSYDLNTEEVVHLHSFFSQPRSLIWTNFEN